VVFSLAVNAVMYGKYATYYKPTLQSSHLPSHDLSLSSSINHNSLNRSYHSGNVPCYCHNSSLL